MTPTPVQFNLDREKVIATVIYLASHHGVTELTAAKLFKLMFLAEKYHLVRYGRPITGDRYDAMKDGPVPSFTYDLFRKQVFKTPFTDEGRRLASSIKVDDSYDMKRISSEAKFDAEQLSKSDIAALDKIILQFGRLPFTALRRITHEMVAYNNAWDVRGKKDSVPMKFEDFFEEDEDAVAGTKDEVIENHILNTVFAKR